MNRYFETLEKIFNLRGGVIDLRLDRMIQALALFDHPESRFPSFHIAGTNGKGSTAAILHNILSLSGYRTALYTSPHLVSFTERIRIGQNSITEDEVMSIAEEIWRRTGDADLRLTFFEFITVMAFVYFGRRPIDAAVVEVGLGGRLDATNVITPVVSVITTIAKDHEAYLGPDEVSIAREKAGIIKAHVPVICGKVSEPVAATLQTIAGERQAPAYFLGTDFIFLLKNGGIFDYTGINKNIFNLNVALHGRHQRINASLALAALEVVQENFPVAESVIRRGLQTVRWPGRLEIVSERPLVILDGAHNPEGVQALAEALHDLRQGRKIKVLFATMADKEWHVMLATLGKIADEIILTRVAMERSADPELLARSRIGSMSYRVIQKSQVALHTLLTESGPDDIIAVAGSLYLLGEVRPMLTGASPGQDPGLSH